jgi:hypothetical protein
MYAILKGKNWTKAQNRTIQILVDAATADKQARWWSTYSKVPIEQFDFIVIDRMPQIHIQSMGNKFWITSCYLMKQPRLTKAFGFSMKKWSASIPTKSLL